MKKEEIKRQVCEIYSRVNGYMRPVSAWNDAKRAEYKNRKYFKLKSDEKESNNPRVH